MGSLGDTKWGKAGGVHSDLRTKDAGWSRGPCMTLEALRREMERGITWEEEKESRGPGETAQCVKCPVERKSSSASQHPCRESGVLQHTPHPSASEVETSGFLGLTGKPV